MRARIHIIGPVLAALVLLATVALRRLRAAADDAASDDAQRSTPTLPAADSIDDADPSTTPAADREHPAEAQQPEHRRRRALATTLRGVLTLAMLAALGATAVLTTQATFTDEVTMAQIAVTGGTLDLQANASDGPGVGWSGALSAAITGMAPGEVRSGTVQITNDGDLPFTLDVSSAGSDADGCFAYHFRETAATGATTAASWPVNLTGMGTDASADGTSAAFATPATAALPDAGADLQWETDDAKTYTLTVRMRTACSQNGAAGTLDFTFNATQ